MIGTAYAASKADFDETLEEWEHIIKKRNFSYAWVTFNANSTLYGYPNEKKRQGETLIECLMTNNLTISNLKTQKQHIKSI